MPAISAKFSIDSGEMMEIVYRLYLSYIKNEGNFGSINIVLSLEYNHFMMKTPFPLSIATTELGGKRVLYIAFSNLDFIYSRSQMEGFFYQQLEYLGIPGYVILETMDKERKIIYNVRTHY